jgi:hypothetical protein
LVSTADSKLPNASGRAPHVRYRNHCGREMLRMSFSVNDFFTQPRPNSDITDRSATCLNPCPRGLPVC